MFGDTILVNGLVYPFLEVERRQYRFRMLNACQARFLNPRLVYASRRERRGARLRSAGPPSSRSGPKAASCPRPSTSTGRRPPTRATRPRASSCSRRPSGPTSIVDFRDVPAGATLLLVADAPAPYPMGDEGNDFYPGNPSTPTSRPGCGPNTRTLLQIRVKARRGAADPPISAGGRLTPTDPFPIHQVPCVPDAEPADAEVRRLTLNEGFDEYGRLIQFLGTDTPVNDDAGVRPAVRHEPTEIVQAGSRRRSGRS